VIRNAWFSAQICSPAARRRTQENEPEGENRFHAHPCVLTESPYEDGWGLHKAHVDDDGWLAAKSGRYRVIAARELPKNHTDLVRARVEL